VANAAKSWTNELVDMTGNNRLLFYRDLRQGTLDLSPETSDAKSRHVESLIAGRTVRLSQLFGTSVSVAARRARTIRAKATENFEERGLRTLMLAHGMATWTNAKTQSVPAAPVLLAEVTLTARGGAAEDFDLVVSGDWEINPTLLHYLETEFQFTIDTDELLEVLDIGATEVLELLASKSRKAVPGFVITPRSIVGNFAYAKLPMVADLQAALASGFLADHDLIAAIAGDLRARQHIRNAQVPGDITEPDTIAPTDEFLILDADASQSHVIAGAIGGSHLVVEGPPGTGKSQTIANLIASLAARRKKVLFVAEKRAAIDAVLDRLRGVGLEDLVLDLHGGAGSRRQLSAELASTMASHASVPRPELSTEQAELTERRAALVAHRTALHELREPWNLSMYQVQAALLGLPSGAGTRLRFAPDQLGALSHSDLEQLANDLREFVELDGLSLTAGEGLFASAFQSRRVPDSAAAQGLMHACTQLRSQTLPAARQQISELVSATGLRSPKSLAEWEQTLQLFADVRSQLDTCDPAIYDAPLSEWETVLAPAGAGPVSRLSARMFHRTYRRALTAARALILNPATPTEVFDLVVAANQLVQSWSACSTDGTGPRVPDDLDVATKTWSAFRSDLEDLQYAIAVWLEDPTFDDVTELVDSFVDDTTTLYRLPRLTELHQRLLDAGIGPLIDSFAEGGADADTTVETLRFMWFTGVAEQIALSDPLIGAFKATKHNRVVADYVSADRKHIAAAPTRVRRSVAEWATEVRSAHPAQSDIVQRQARLKRRHMPVRDLFQAAPDVLGAMKPCWVMSPLVVSQLLPLQRCFDVVIFDEASQVTPADSMGAIMRASQTIVAGDAKQLPPTSFFDAAASDVEDPDDDGLALTTGLESVLDVMSALLPPPHGSKMLAWHYRSRDERLISFSNAQPSLYDWSLTTFPGVTQGGCLTHHLVPWSPGSDESSTDEVNTVVELIFDHARQRPDESLGVIAFGIKHAERISETLRRRRGEHPELDRWFDFGPEDRGKPEPLFIKNLERVQGDERDAIILSVGYGKGPDGRMHYRFGPLNMQGGERRLNVAITRARVRMSVVASFSSTDLDPAKLRAEGAKMLGRYLAYAESAGTDLGHITRDRPPLNPFERDVQRRLEALDIPLVPQFGASGYWIDFAAAHPQRPGQMVLAIECDGASYHSSPTARDRDRLRQEHLERLGWSFHRIWSTQWFREPESEAAKARAAYDKAVKAADRPKRNSGKSKPPSETVAAPMGGPRRHAKPRLRPAGTPIDEYRNDELVALVEWVESDTLLRTDEELFEELVQALGYKRRGPKISARLTSAITQVRG
jgi:very-short-patch-repair endonuclease